LVYSFFALALENVRVTTRDYPYKPSLKVGAILYGCPWYIIIWELPNDDFGFYGGERTPFSNLN